MGQAKRRPAAKTRVKARPGGGARAGLAVVLAGLLAAAAGAQTPVERTMRAFFEPLEVPLVNVEVYVADADGGPVSGLTAADFEVLEDGEPVEVTHFYAAPLVAVEEVAEVPGVEQPPPVDQELYLVVFLDELDLAPSQRRATIDHLRGFLTQELPPRLRLMFVTYDGRTRIRVPFTDDPSRLVEVLDGIGREASLSPDIERSRILRDMQSTAAALAGASGGGGGGGPRAASQMGEAIVEEARGYVQTIRTYAERRRQGTARLLGELQGMVRGLSGVPGRKAVLLVCDGLETRPGEGLFQTWEQIFPEVAREMHILPFNEGRKNDLGPSFRELVHYANGQRVSFYTLSSLGARVSAGISAEGRGNLATGNVAQAMAEEEALMYVSGGTGGRSLANSPGLAERLGEVSEELAAYYSLGFVPGHSGDGKYHTLEVNVRREGVKVRHREGYLDTGASDRMADRTLAAAVLGVTDNPLRVSVEAREVKPSDVKGACVVPILVKIPIDQLVLVPQESEHTGQVTVVVAVQGSDGLSDVQQWRYPITVSNDQLLTALHQEAGFSMGLLMREGPQRVAVGVRDDVARIEATTTLEIDVQQPAATGSADAAS